MTSDALEAYLATAEPAAAPLVRALHQSIVTAEPGLVPAIRYRILMYALHGDYRTWVCAINAGRRSVGLQFLYGVLLADPRVVLRAGTSVLKTWDFAFGQAVDPVAVGAYVREAAGRYDEYRANAGTVLAAAREAAGARSRAGRR